MIGAFLSFNKGVMALPKLWQGWMVLLVSANLLSPLFFLDRLEARVVVGAVLIAMIIMTALNARLGFVRLLGLGHILWIPMVPWLYTRVGEASAGSTFFYWLWAVIILDSISVIIDGVDVVRYLAGEQAPTVAVS